TYKETVKTARTMKQAEEAERQARQAVHDGVYGVRGRQMRFSQFVEESYLPWSEQNCRASSHDQHKIHAAMLCEYFAGRTLGQIAGLAVERFKRDRAATATMHGGTRSPNTVNSELTTLSGILSLAVTHRLIRENPCVKVKRLQTEEGPSRRLTSDEEQALLESAELERPFLKPMIQLALWTGLRQGELIALTKSAISFERNRLFVVNPKWRKDKRKTEGNPMSAEVRSLLSELCAQATGDLLFPARDGGRLDRSTVLFLFRSACARAGIVGLRFHDLRHEYGSRLGDADVNLKKISRLMGHSNTKQTERYVHPTDEGLLAATEVAAKPARSTIVPHGLKRVC
ncbi:MAG TPA: site-specific integrase, partial [Pyrinomonadaceae bacterium]|nr:site-specific integrase [Pyrinomonadaceae bacterium]